jgi:hypothetical protein
LERGEPMEIVIVQRDERSRLVRVVASRIIRLETDRMVEAKIQARLRDFELLFGCGTAGKNTDKCRLMIILGLPLLDFEVNCAGCPGFDPLGSSLQKASKERGSPSHSEIRLVIM